MTEFQQLVHAIEARGRAAAVRATVRARRTVAARAAALPGLTVLDDDDGVHLTAPGLAARAFGSRRAAADPRLQGLTL